MILSASLISGPNLVSLFLQIFLSMGIQSGVIFFLSSKPWYVPLHPSSPKQEIIKCWETTSLFCVSSFQYLILAVIFRLVNSWILLIECYFLIIVENRIDLVHTLFLERSSYHSRSRNYFCIQCKISIALEC